MCDDTARKPDGEPRKDCGDPRPEENSPKIDATWKWDGYLNEDEEPSGEHWVNENPKFLGNVEGIVHLAKDTEAQFRTRVAGMKRKESPSAPLPRAFMRL